MDSPFCASSDENIQGKSTTVLAQGVDFAWIFEEHRDNARMKFWHLRYSRKRTMRSERSHHI